MPNQLEQFINRFDGQSAQIGYAIAPGIVINNLDSIAEGRVQVRIPTLPSYEPWARVAAVGGGSNRGFLWIPQMDDEVLVGFNQNDERDAFILGGLWSTADRPPATIPTDFITKRIIKTGTKLTPGLAHEIEMDDALQSIKVTSSTGQKVTIDPTKIELSTTGGTLSIKLDLTTQTISVDSTLNLNLKAIGKVNIEGAQVNIKGLQVNVQSTGPCSIQGLPIKLN